MRFVGIDPGTKTGFVALDSTGQVVKSKELTGIGTKDPRRMVTLIDEVIKHTDTEDLICVEGFGFSTQQGIMLGGIGWGLRMALFRRRMKYLEAAPGSLKKFASGKGNTGKDELAVHIYKRYGFEHSSDNVRDAYVLAQIARAIHNRHRDAFTHTKAQREVIETVLNPTPKSKKKKVK
ncbi:hypothetical protein D7Z54_14475 [Salibacterium salarium]|uniref:Uncharacterized protein n=1 Tax=Salibacterium salarium TaxID=284579 RepID=A0A3R9PKA4_9BACI|nr:hypothetical protein [Salibacterium salarium]RSL32653.1 hypothetical protein D7Z54_14475 [Salibacterium salarium]